MNAVRLAYLVSVYPAVSHTFILREIMRLRELGLEIVTASVNPPDRAREVMDDCERGDDNGRKYFLHGCNDGLHAWQALSR